MMKYVLLALAALTLTACGSFGSTDEPLAATPPPVEVIVAEQDVPVIVAEQPTAVPTIVPRVKQAQIVGVLREMRANGCILQKVANTDGIHYSQLVVTCGAPQAVPAVE